MRNLLIIKVFFLALAGLAQAQQPSPQAARDTVTSDAQDAETYAQVRLKALLAELDALPLSSRVPDWKASVAAAQASGSP